MKLLRWQDHGAAVRLRGKGPLRGEAGANQAAHAKPLALREHLILVLLAAHHPFQDVQSIMALTIVLEQNHVAGDDLLPDDGHKLRHEVLRPRADVLDELELQQRALPQLVQGSSD